MASKIWKGHLSFGLVSIPVALMVGARADSVELHQYHQGSTDPKSGKFVLCGSRMGRQEVCKTCNKPVPKEEVIKGYETGESSYIPITKQDFETILPESEKVMEISECVKWADVDPVYLAESFYLVPDVAGKKAYSLLVKALADSGRVAIAQLTKNNRENIALIRPRGAGLMLHFLYYPTEVAQVAEFDNLKLEALTAAEVKLANQLVQSMAADFTPAEFEDGYAQRLNTLIASKMKDSKVKAPTATKSNVVTMPDIAAALTASLAKPKAKKAKRAA